MKPTQLPYILQALLAAVLFGVSAPLSKLLLGDVPPVLLAAFLYLGSGAGITLLKTWQRMRQPGQPTEAALTRPDLPWLTSGILVGGVIAPIILMVSLKATPGSTASLLLNFESVCTTLIASVAFKEAIGTRPWVAILAITLAGILLSTNFGQGGWGLSPGALGIILACAFWGLDNNLTRNISDKDPLAIVSWKGLLAGTFSLALGLFLGNQFPPIFIVLITLLIGWGCYGLGTVLFVQAMRGLGAARTSALYGTAPLAGVALSVFMFGEIPSLLFIAAAILALGGAWLLVDEKHSHIHFHPAMTHDHRHSHTDDSHSHDDHSGIHAGQHTHPAEQHDHDHTPDIHHRHTH